MAYTFKAGSKGIVIGKVMRKDKKLGKYGDSEQVQ